MTPLDTDPTETARQVANLISEFRQEVIDKVRNEIEQEVFEVELAEFDPARGRGRGPAWMDGAIS